MFGEFGWLQGCCTALSLFGLPSWLSSRFELGHRQTAGGQAQRLYIYVQRKAWQSRGARQFKLQTMQKPRGEAAPQTTRLHRICRTWKQMPRRVPGHPLTPRRAGRSATVAGAVKIQPYVRLAAYFIRHRKSAQASKPWAPERCHAWHRSAAHERQHEWCLWTPGPPLALLQPPWPSCGALVLCLQTRKMGVPPPAPPPVQAPHGRLLPGRLPRSNAHMSVTMQNSYRPRPPLRRSLVPRTSAGADRQPLNWARPSSSRDTRCLLATLP